MATVLITGGAGFLGSHLCDRFLSEGWEVIALDSFLTGTPDNLAHLFGQPRFRFIKYDVTHYIFVPEQLNVILHFACPASPADYMRYKIHTMKVDSLGTLHTLGLAKAKGARYVLASTSEIYGDPEVHPQTESYWGHVNPIGPRSVYDEAKRFSEALSMAYHHTHGLDVRIARIFNSVLADQRVIFFNDDHCSLLKIQQYADQLKSQRLSFPRQVMVPAFDPQTFTLSLKRAVTLVKHPNVRGDAYEVLTRYGRRIKVTGDHSLFKRGPDGIPVATPVRELKRGDYVAIPGKLPVVEKDVTVINLAQHLMDWCSSSEELWDYTIITDELGEVIRENRDLIEEILSQSSRFDGSRRKRNTVGCAYRKYRSRHFLPLYVVDQLRRRRPIDLPAGAQLGLYTAGSSVAIPNQIEVTNDVLWLLGLFLAEGNIRDSEGTYGIAFSSDMRYLRRAQQVLRRAFGVRAGWVKPTPSHPAPALYAHSKLVLYLFDRVFELGQVSGEKRIPAWVFQLPLSRLKHFLEGYREGDGTHSGKKVGKELCFDTTSEALATDLVYLLLRFGIVACVGKYTTTFRERYGERRFPFYRVTVCSLSNFDVLTWDQGVQQVLNARRLGDLVWARVRSVRRCKTSQFVYDFVVPSAENFLAGNGVVAHNTYGPRMRLNDGRAVPNFITQALKGEPLTVYGEGHQTRSFCYVTDLVEGVYRLATVEGLAGEVLNLGNPDEYQIVELAAIIKELTGSSAPIMFEPLPQDDPRQRQPDITRARKFLAWQPEVGLRDGLEQTVAYFRKRLQAETGEI